RRRRVCFRQRLRGAGLESRVRAARARDLEGKFPGAARPGENLSTQGAAAKAQTRGGAGTPAPSAAAPRGGPLTRSPFFSGLARGLRCAPLFVLSAICSN